jgi:Ca-activated chloride channel homolog
MKRRATWIAAFAVALALGPVSRAAQQGPPPPPPPPDPVPETAPPAGQDDDQVDLGTALVNVPFNVTDKKNRHITDVQQSEVQVLEDGQQQEIFSFERLLQTPLTISLLIDTSGSQEATIGIEREAARRFFEKVLRPDRDLGSVITFSKEVVLEQELTANRTLLERALDRARVSPASAFGRGGTAPTNPTAGGTSMNDAVFLASEDVLRREAGRRVIILLTDGFDTTSVYNKEAAIERSWRSEVIIYCIGIGDPGYGGVASGVLDKYAKETGGRTFEPRGIDDLDKAFQEIENDLRQQYVVSYTPSNTTRDGSFRKIEVKLAGETRKDLRIRYRRGYYAPKG